MTRRDESGVIAGPAGPEISTATEWLEADGLGGFASGTAAGIRTRRYHALLLTAATPPTGRMVMVNGFDAWILTPAGRFALTTQRYRPDVLHPDGSPRIRAFTADPWPRWEFSLPDGLSIVHEVVAGRDGTTVLTWRRTDLDAQAPPGTGVALDVRPFFSGRDYHALHHENDAFRFEPEANDVAWVWRPYQGVPTVAVRTNGSYSHAPEWYRQFVYEVERERGLDDAEDLASPGVFRFDLGGPADQAVMLLSVAVPSGDPSDAVQAARRIREAERTRRTVKPPLVRTADAYLVKRGAGCSIIAGYPWFTDWGRDTFIAVRGLCIAPGRLDAACDVLLEWSDAVSDGMLPNRFPDAGETPEYNAVDASLWYVIAVHDLLEAAAGSSAVTPADRERLCRATDQILRGYVAGTRFGIRADEDGLLSSGQPGQQLTWMDARSDGREVTPRIGKPVEVQALWVNALWVASQRDPAWCAMYERARASFAEGFWNRDRNCLFDVIDVDHIPGITDDTIRPNQIFAVGGLPLTLIDAKQARSVVDCVERHLLTPFGLRSLAPGEPGYAAQYEGGPDQRDAAYHQGTVWPWLLGAFVDAWVRVRGNTNAARQEARRRIVQPLLDHVAAAGGHLCEITDAEPPFHPRGCPFQAWSLGELMRAERLTRN